MHVRPSPVFGIGLRSSHFDQILSSHDGVDFLEIVSDNFMSMGGKEHFVLEQVKEVFPIVLHGVGLSIGGPDPLNQDYLKSLLELIQFVKPPFFSDHLCLSSAFGVEYHDLIPLPFSEEVVQHVVPRIKAVQAMAQIPFLIENPSYYVRMPGSKLSEEEFIREILEKSGCGLLLDVNNVYVNAENHQYDPYAFIASIPPEKVYQYHMAGHFKEEGVIIDTHGDHVADPVMDLYRYALEKIGHRPTLLEWDTDIPELEVLLEENRKIRRAAESVKMSMAR